MLQRKKVITYGHRKRQRVSEASFSPTWPPDEPLHAAEPLEPPSIQSPRQPRIPVPLRHQSINDYFAFTVEDDENVAEPPTKKRRLSSTSPVQIVPGIRTSAKKERASEHSLVQTPRNISKELADTISEQPSPDHVNHPKQSTKKPKRKPVKTPVSGHRETEGTIAKPITPERTSRRSARHLSDRLVTQDGSNDIEDPFDFSTHGSRSSGHNRPRLQHSLDDSPTLSTPSKRSSQRASPFSDDHSEGPGLESPTRQRYRDPLTHRGSPRIKQADNVNTTPAKKKGNAHSITLSDHSFADRDSIHDDSPNLDSVDSDHAEVTTGDLHHSLSRTPSTPSFDLIGIASAPGSGSTQKTLPLKVRATPPKTILDDLDQLLPRGIASPPPKPPAEIEPKSPTRETHITDFAAPSPKRRLRVARMKDSGGIPSPGKKHIPFATADNATLSAIAGVHSVEAEYHESSEATCLNENGSRPSTWRSTFSHDLEPTEIVPPHPLMSIEPIPSVTRRPISVTYARTRSFLETEEDLYATKYVSETRRRKEEGLESSDEEGGFKEVKSIHELRQAGEAKRIADEMDYILGGLAREEALSVQRSSCFELSKKVLSASFVSNVRAHGFLPKFHEFARTAEDSILLAMITFVYCGFLQDKRNLEHLVIEPDLLDLLARSLMLAHDPLCMPLKSKFERRLMLDYKSWLATASFLDPIAPDVKLSDMALYCMTLIASAKPPNTAYLQRRLRELDALDKVVSTFMKGIQDFTCGRLDEMISEESSGVDLPLASNAMCLRLLQFATLSCQANGEVVASTPDFVDQSLKAIALASVVARTTQEEAEKASSFLHRILSLLVNLSNDCPDCTENIGKSPWLGPVMRCALVANPFLLATDDDDSTSPTSETAPELESPESTAVHEKRVSNFGIMMLGTALLANLVQNNVANRTRLKRTECIAASVNDRLAMECQTSGHAVLTGQVTMLLGFLIKDTAQNRTLALARMTHHGHSFRPVIEMLENFARLYDDMITAPAPTNSGDDRTSLEPKGVVTGLIDVFKGVG
ncbi:hypothetical protein PhCBS80983_g01493 [Powellomyces hirtus]|uniref:Wings apart-like protein C-terminal domain-containing protein n=1 Tax=Powellomyces hirtus TaxID=109895 RepID=A0A507EB23_9FUNG|nr:hypothetical protein PhCBS80983_g01493 [Powellomyces hirtus]